MMCVYRTLHFEDSRNLSSLLATFQRHMDFNDVISLLKQLVSQKVPRIRIIFRSCVIEERSRHFPNRDGSFDDNEEGNHDDNNYQHSISSPIIISPDMPTRTISRFQADEHRSFDGFGHSYTERAGNDDSDGVIDLTK